MCRTSSGPSLESAAMRTRSPSLTGMRQIAQRWPGLATRIVISSSNGASPSNASFVRKGYSRRTFTLTYAPQTRCSVTAGSARFRTMALTVWPSTDVVGRLTTSHWPVSSLNWSPARRCIENIDPAGGGAPGFFFDLGIRVRRPTYNHGGASAEVMLTRALLHRDRNNAHGRRGDEEASKSALARVDAGTARGSLAHAAADRTCQGVFPLSAREGAEARTTR